MTKVRSQLGQDEWVVRNTQHFQNKYFVEAGALDGLHLTNTLMLEEQCDWNGLCIEPSPCYHELVRNRKCRKSDACLARESGMEVSFIHVEDEPALSGTVGSQGPHYGTHERHLRLTTKTLTQVLDENHSPQIITYLSLDTEGSELEILQGVDFNRYVFSLITIEHNYVEPRRTQIHAFLRTLGYVRVRKQQWDDWYMYPDHFPKWQVARELIKEQWRKLRVNLTSWTSLQGRLDNISPFRWGWVDLQKVLRKFAPAAVIHVGGHHGQEASTYSKAGVRDVLWVEANPDSFKILERNVRIYGHMAANYAAFSASGKELDFMISSNSAGISSSLYPLGAEMRSMYPEIQMGLTIKVPTISIQDLLKQMGLNPQRFELLVLDVQGAELEVLKGMVSLLKNFKAIVSEVSRKEVYLGGARSDVLKLFLSEHGFQSPFQFVRPANADLLFIRRQQPT